VKSAAAVESIRTEIPAKWAWAKLGDICSTTSGGTPSRKISAYFQGAIPWVKSGELPDGPVTEIEECISDEAVKNSSAKVFPGGTLLIALYGATVGKLGVLTRRAATNQAVCAIFPPDILDTKYLFWYLRNVRADLVAQAVGGAQPNISQGILRDLSIPVAPLPEQTRIVAEIEKQFSRLDEAVANLKRVKANLKRYKATVLNAAVEGKLTEEWRKLHPDAEPADKLLERILAERRKGAGKGKYKEPAGPEVADLPELPAGWVWASPAQLSYGERYSLAIGPFGSNLKVSDYKTSGVPLVFVRNIRATDFGGDSTVYITAEKADELRAHQVSGGDLLITKMGAPPGDVCIYPESRPDAVITADCIKFRLASNLLNKLFFLRAIESKVIKNQILGVTKGVAQLKVSLERFSTIGLPIPPLAEQHQIVAEIERRLSIVAGAEAQVDANLRRADRLRQSILKQAYSGQLVPQDPNDEPASVLLERIRNVNVGADRVRPEHVNRKAVSCDASISKPRQKATSNSAASNDFDSLDSALAAILNRMQTGREYSRSEIAEPLSLSTGRWNAAIQELKRRRQVRQVGERKGAKYSVTQCG
jgi:type I restriction enzyme S subunit